MTEDVSSQDTTAVETAENTVETVVGNADEQASNQEVPSDFEPLTATYERLRHSADAAELSEFARRPLPDRSLNLPCPRCISNILKLCSTPAARPAS